MTLVAALNLAGVAVFAATGALEAGRKQLDMFGVVVIAVVAALGGGTLRDLLLDRAVFWVVDQVYVGVALGSAMLTFVIARKVVLPPRLFLIPDALGLALVTVLGTQIALAVGVAWFVASVMGVITGVFGGILRDVLCNEVPLVFGSELYATAAWAGALLLVLLEARGADGAAAVLPPMIAILVLRLAAMRWHLTLPRYSAR